MFASHAKCSFSFCTAVGCPRHVARMSIKLHIMQPAVEHAGMSQRQAVQAALRAFSLRSAAQRCG